MLLFLTLIAALPPHPSWSESMVYQLNGLIVVLVALCSIWGVLELTGIYFRRAAGAIPRATPVPSASEAAAKVAPQSDGIPPETVAAIASAVSVAIKGDHRIHAIVPVPTPAGTTSPTDPVR